MGLFLNKKLGIDIGGTNIKGGIVNTKNGQFVSNIVKMKTPVRATPENVLGVMQQIILEFKWKGQVGVGFPGVINNGYVTICNNLDKDFIGLNIAQYFADKLKLNTTVKNDVDAAALAEMKYGEGRVNKGKVMFVSLGTGVGTCLFNESKVISNLELGQLYLANGFIAEQYLSNKVRNTDDLSWKEWGTRLNSYLIYINKLINPEKIILLGGVTKKAEKYLKYIDNNLNVKIGRFKNRSGIIGSALH